VPSRIFFGNPASGVSAQTINLAPVVVDVVLPAVGVAQNQIISLAPVVVDVVVPASALAQPQTIALAPVVVDVVLPANTMEFSIDLAPVVVHVVIPALTVRRWASIPAGITGVIIEQPDGSAVSGLAGPLVALHPYRINRYQNRVGDWEVTVAIDDQLIGGVPLHKQVKRGWRVTLVQENNSPDGLIVERYLVYRGIVETREYAVDQSGSATLTLAGSMRTVALVSRSTQRGLAYAAQSVETITEDLVDGTNIIGSPGGIILPNEAATRTPTVAFNDISRFAALVKTAEISRFAYREGWDYDRPELTHIDGPVPRVLLTNAEAFDPGQDRIGTENVGLIGQPPKVRYDGARLLNRIIPIGADTPDGDLTLESATTAAPYTVLTALNPDGSSYWYLEDAYSIATYGLVEQQLVRTDVKNPSDNAGTRAAAANVLYALAAGELLKRRSEIIYLTVPLANGHHIWSLPGDAVRVVYSGDVEGESGRVNWLEIDQVMLVTERHEASDPSGVRQVELVLAAPEIEYHVPPLPEAVPGSDDIPGTPEENSVSLPPEGGFDDSGTGDFGMGDLPGFGGLPGWDVGFDCCDDPTTDIPSGAEPPPDADLTDGSTEMQLSGAGSGSGGATNWTVLNSNQMEVSGLTVPETHLVGCLVVWKSTGAPTVVSVQENNPGVGTNPPAGTVVDLEVLADFTFESGRARMVVVAGRTTAAVSTPYILNVVVTLSSAPDRGAYRTAILNRNDFEVIETLTGTAAAATGISVATTSPLASSLLIGFGCAAESPSTDVSDLSPVAPAVAGGVVYDSEAPSPPSAQASPIRLKDGYSGAADTFAWTWGPAVADGAIAVVRLGAPGDG
jgi:hypothetical protein